MEPDSKRRRQTRGRGRGGVADGGDVETILSPLSQADALSQPQPQPQPLGQPQSPPQTYQSFTPTPPQSQSQSQPLPQGSRADTAYGGDDEGSENVPVNVPAAGGVGVPAAGEKRKDVSGSVDAITGRREAEAVVDDVIPQNKGHEATTTPSPRSPPPPPPRLGFAAFSLLARAVGLLDLCITYTGTVRMPLGGSSGLEGVKVKYIVDSCYVSVHIICRLCSSCSRLCLLFPTEPLSRAAPPASARAPRPRPLRRCGSGRAG
jgi:hypothetical protein